MLKIVLMLLLAAQAREKRVSPVPADERLQFERQRRAGVAVLVGVGQYPRFSGFSELHYPGRDVDQLQVELEKQHYLVIPMKEADANKGTVLNAIAQAGDAAQRSGGTMVFYFSGHGFADRGANYLALHDASATNLAESGLAVSAVEEQMRKAGVTRRVLWIDACRNDPAKKGNERARSFDRLQASVGTRILFSTRAGDVSYEDDTLRDGLFTYNLLAGLRGEAAGPDGMITFRDLTDYVIDAVEAQSLKRGSAQVPYEAGESRGDFLLARVAEGGRPVVPPPAPVERGPKAGDTRVNAKDGLTYVWIPPGRFVMGCSPGDNECDSDEAKPQRETSIPRPLWMGQTSVTVGAWKRYRAATNAAALPVKDGLGRKLNEEAGDDRLPAVAMTWDEAKKYCSWSWNGGRLPTEAEWEYAARAGTTGARYAALDDIAWYGDNSGRRRIDSTALWKADSKSYFQKLFDNGNGPRPVQGKLSNAWNLYDMLGNVWQWMDDWYDSDKKYKSLRGGSWNSNPVLVRVSFRYGFVPEVRSYLIGFRCVGD